MRTSSVNLRGRLHTHVQFLSLSLMLCGSHGVYRSDLPSGELLWGCSWWRAFSCRTSRSTIAFSQGHVLQGLASGWTQCLVSPALGGAPLRSNSCLGLSTGPAETFLGLQPQAPPIQRTFCLSLLLQVSDQHRSLEPLPAYCCLLLLPLSALHHRRFPL